MLASFAEYERETIVERTRAGLHRAYRGGKHYGAAPYGYQTDQHGHLQVVPEEAEIVREIVGNVVELLVQSVSAGKHPDDGRTEIQVTYRFGPPPTGVSEDSSVVHFKNGRRS